MWLPLERSRARIAAAYDATRLQGKQACRRALQAEMGLLPDDDAGMLVVRSRKVDVLTLAVLGVGLTIFTFWVPAPS